MSKLHGNETKSILYGSGLVLLNIILMWLLTYTPVPALTYLAFDYFIVGILIVGALLWVGKWLAVSGVETGNNAKAIAGVGVLQFAYGAIGSSVLFLFDEATAFTGIIIAAAVTSILTFVVSMYVYKSNKNFAIWGTYSSYVFWAAIASAVVGTFVSGFIFLTFILTFIGFLMYLVFEVWKMRTHPKETFLNALGIYIAVTGVFLHILQLVLRLLSRRN